MGRVHDDPALRDRAPVFRDRWDAGERLGRHLAGFPGLTDPLVCPVPAGGIPVGIAVGRVLRCPLHPLIVRKVRIPWNPEAGFGAVSWDGRVFLNEDLLHRLRLPPDRVREAVAEARANVRERVRRFAAGVDCVEVAGRTCIIVDDGLASGFTMTAAAVSLTSLGPGNIIVAVPTGSPLAVSRVALLAGDLICLNVRGGDSFAVADAYEEWYDLSEEEGEALLSGALKERTGRVE